MSDLVERLRAQRDHADDWRTSLAEEAADEIERLQKWDGDLASGLADALEQRDAARKEIERLQARVAELESQNERLQLCRRELAEVTEAMDDPTINLTRTLVEAVEALRARVAELEQYACGVRCPNCDNLRLELGEQRRRVAELEKAVSAEREACAKVCNDYIGCEQVARDIRARGKNHE